MKNVGVAVAATAWLFASATEAWRSTSRASSPSAGQARLAKEQTDGGIAAVADLVLPAWRKWYSEAVRSADRLVVGRSIGRLRRPGAGDRPAVRGALSPPA